MSSTATRLWLVLALAAPASAEPARTAAAFLRRPLGARAAGMAGGHAAVRGSADSLQYNPAGLSTLAGPHLTTTYLSGFGGTSHGFLGYAHPTRLGTLAASALYFNGGDIELNLSDGTQRSVNAEKDYAWGVSYAAALPLGLHLGGSYRFLRMDLAETASATGSLADLGGLWRLGALVPGLSLGAAYQHLGKDIRFESAGDPPPKTLRLGAALHFPDVPAAKLDPSVDLQQFDATVAADWVKVLREEASPRVGVELGLTPSYSNRIALRFGWVFNRDAESLTFGVGFRQGPLGFDYALGKGKDVGALNQLSLTLSF